MPHERFDTTGWAVGRDDGTEYGPVSGAEVPIGLQDAIAVDVHHGYAVRIKARFQSVAGEEGTVADVGIDH
jgi:hypothetical protein